MNQKTTLIVSLFLMLFLFESFTVRKIKPLQVYRDKFSLYVKVKNKITFETNEVKLNTTALHELGVISNELIDNKNLKIEIQVFTDTRNDPEFSLAITQKRADVIKKYLIHNGVNADNLIAKGYGDNYILNKCKPFVKCTESEHAINRRVELKILNPEELENYIMVKN